MELAALQVYVHANSLHICPQERGMDKDLTSVRMYAHTGTSVRMYAHTGIDLTSVRMPT